MLISSINVGRLSLEALKRVVVGLLDGYAFHFDKPTGAAYRGKHDDVWLVGESLFEEFANYGVVAGVT